MRASSVIGHRSSVVPILVGILLAIGCGGSGGRSSERAAGDTLTERQRDSILAKSKIPGAPAVGRAMNAADSMSARVRVTDTVQ